MKTLLMAVLLLIGLSIGIYSCVKSSAQHAFSTPKMLEGITSNGFDTLGKFVGTGALIPVEDANRMIQSYLSSTASLTATDANPIRAWTINGSALSKLLSDPSVKSAKFMLAHNKDYILSGKEGIVPLATGNTLTLIVVGLDSAGNYVTQDGDVLDNSMPCPEICPPGNGANTTIDNP